MRRGAGAAALAAAALCGGCESQWYSQSVRSEIVRTDVVVRTDPAGGVVRFNGVRQDVAPVRIPVEYEHRTEQWVRTSNQGAAMRESLGPVGTVLLFPVWGVASFFHAKQEMKRHVYAANRHVVSAELSGARDERTVDLQGEAEVVVDLSLR